MTSWERKVKAYQTWKIIPDIIRWVLILGVLGAVFYFILTADVWGAIVWAILWIPIGFILLINVIGFLTLPLYALLALIFKVNLRDVIEKEPINLDEVRSGFFGKPYNALVQYHIKRESAQILAMSVEGTKNMLPTGTISYLVEFCDRWNLKAYDANFWEEDCAEVFTKIMDDAAEVLLQSGIRPDDETLFNIFQLVTLNFALAASLQPKMRKFAGIKKGLFS